MDSLAQPPDTMLFTIHIFALFHFHSDLFSTFSELYREEFILQGAEGIGRDQD